MSSSSNGSYDEDITSDVDDEVFIKSLRNGHRHAGKDCSLHKPLMAPRSRKQHKGDLGPAVKIFQTPAHRPPLIINILYILIIIGVLFGLAGAAVVLAQSRFGFLVGRVGRNFWSQASSAISNTQQLHPIQCDSFTDLETVWEVDIPHSTAVGGKLVETFDLDGDSVEDTVIGLATGADSLTKSTAFFCAVYFNISSPVCSGSLVALSGKSGHVLWRLWLSEAVSQVYCPVDLDLDGVRDCLVLGRTQAVWAVSSREGKILWQMLTDQMISCTEGGFVGAPRSVQVVADVSGDKIADVVAGWPGHTDLCPGHFILINGYTGKLLQVSATADNQPLTLGPLLKSSGDGAVLLLYATLPGNLYLTALNDLLSGHSEQVRTLLSNASRIVGLALADLNADGMEDVLVTHVNGSLIVLCGNTYRSLWSYAVAAGVDLRMDSLARLNQDAIPDVTLRLKLTTNGTLIHATEVLDGATGKLEMHLPSRPAGWDVGGAVITTSGVSDLVLHWVAEDGPAGRKRNQLLGFSSHGELPALTVYSTPDPSTLPPSSHLKEKQDSHSMDRVMETLSARTDLRNRFNGFVRMSQRAGGWRSVGLLTGEDNPASVTNPELEPGAIGYAQQHGVRKHGGRWNDHQRQMAYQTRPSAYDYNDSGPPPLADDGIEHLRETERTGLGRTSWGHQSPLTPQQPLPVLDNGDGDYIEVAPLPVDYDSRNNGADFSFERAVSWPRPPIQRNQRRGKRIRRSLPAPFSTSPPPLSPPPPPPVDLAEAVERIRVAPSVLRSPVDDAADVLLLVQRSYLNAPGRTERLSECVAGRLNQGLGGEEVADVVLDCWWHPSSLTSDEVDPRLVAAVNQWIRPLVLTDAILRVRRRRLHCPAGTATVVAAERYLIDFDVDEVAG